MNRDEQLTKQFEEFQKLAGGNKNVDVAALMVGALNLSGQKRNVLPAQAKRWAYIISLVLPPFGILFALKYYYGGEDDARQVAWGCIILTAVSGILAWVIVGSMTSNLGAA